MAPQTTPANEWAEARPGTGSEHPDELPATNYLQIERTFCFADLSGFTRYTSEHGPLAAVDRLGEFREVSRDVAAKRGVRVAKWLGDGVMLVGVEAYEVVEAVVDIELIVDLAGSELPIRAGIARGDVMVVDGDDIIGRPAILAARLCDLAAEHHVLAEEGTIEPIMANVGLEPLEASSSSPAASSVPPVQRRSLFGRDATFREALTTPLFIKLTMGYFV